jgi:ubiquinol-cytochrome c reductase cytochrome b subunit
VGIGLLLLAMGMGFTGYSLPDDLLSGTGLRIAYSVLVSVPFVGPHLAFLIFGGEFPTEGIISRLFVLHVMLLPALIIGLITAHLLILWRQKHTQFKGTGRT